ncbi:efflux RND transporter periplasmic adaptor subunit [Eilatimonas milleporae]|uniref:Cobalt-zinc-cadmium efflux system membrane fusion protein n=1 Tax=Eilatimonas milleporae TaxID=911205 RepID=A0A3M0CG79_9PROT|nr:HlyD family efflux transporter periplasmic adaptor subunit [Eilatimonas milleporae]RMB08608.1 cobalt-zinc-cadmium efflux system membrane fusion protein [Eilatimonas milleporae]
MIRARLFKVYVATLAASALMLSGCSDPSAPPAEPGGAAEQTDVKGPKGGRLLSDGDFALEVTIHEAGTAPEFRLYAYENGVPLPPGQVNAAIELERLGGRTDRFAFAPRGAYLLGDGVVAEPHSFTVSVSAEHGGRRASWRYDSFEGRTQIEDAIATAAGVQTEIAGPASIRQTLTATGVVAFAPDAVAEVKSPYVARVLSVDVSVGDRVRRGAPVIRLENVSTLQPITLTAPIDGVVLERRTNVGDVSGGDGLLCIGDTAQLEARLHIFPQDRPRVNVGMPVRIAHPGGNGTIAAKVFAYMPITAMGSQTLIARAVLPPDTNLLPGMRITGEIETGAMDAPLAVRTAALQRFRDFTVVFAKVGETYEVRMLDLGPQDRDWAAVRGGLAPGTEYVTANAFLIKADVEKSGASHDH